MTDPREVCMTTTDREVETIAAGLTKSERIVILGGVTWSGVQRNRLIEKGIAPETCRGAPPMSRTSPYHSFRYALPLTPLGLAVRAHLASQERDKA